MKKVTVMVYMAADNNLDLFSSKDLDEMMKVGSTPSVTILAEVDRRRAFLSEDDIKPQLNTKRFLIEKNNLQEIKDLGETNTGDYHTLNSFINWGLKDYPAIKEFVIIWNHGGGVKDTEIYERFGKEMKRPLFGQPHRGHDIRWVANDDTSRDFLDMNELKKALELKKKIWFIGFDACLMSGFEVMYQLRDAAEFMVASQEIEPLDGWSYSEILDEIDKKAESIEQFSNHLVTSFINTYASTDKSVTLSVIDLNKAEDIGKKISILSEHLLNHFSEYEASILKISRRVQKFRDHDYIDLVDFAKLCKKYIKDKEVRTAADELIEAIKSAVIANGKKRIDNANGISMLFPVQRLDNKVRKEYENLSYTIDYPNWYRLIEKME